MLDKGHGKQEKRTINKQGHLQNKKHLETINEGKQETRTK